MLIKKVIQKIIKIKTKEIESKEKKRESKFMLNKIY
jgi:hypothetical protein